MFRPQVIRRSFSLLKRRPDSAIIEKAARDGHATIRIQRVRITKPFFTRPHLIGAAVAVAAAYGTIRWLDLKIEEEEEAQRTSPRTPTRPRKPKHNIPSLPKDSEVVNAENKGHIEEKEAEADEEGDDDEEDDDAEAILFFPTGLSRPKPRTFYKGSDPEWQEFARIATDPLKIRKIKHELVAIVRASLQNRPGHVQILGDIDPSKGFHWLEPKWPEGPPLEYERPGYELTDDLVLRQATRPVEGLHHRRLSNLLSPIPVVNSMFADITRRLNQSWTSLKGYFTFKENPKPDTAQKLLTQFIPTPSASRPNSPAASATASSAAASPLTSPSVDSTAAPSPSSTENGSVYERLSNSLLNPSAPPIMDLSYFRDMFRSRRKPLVVEPPRGTFIITGMMEIVGTRAKMIVDVVGVYDPKRGSFIALTARGRQIIPDFEKPRGGP